MASDRCPVIHGHGVGAAAVIVGNAESSYLDYVEPADDFYFCCLPSGSDGCGLGNSTQLFSIWALDVNAVALAGSLMCRWDRRN